MKQTPVVGFALDKAQRLRRKPERMAAMLSRSGGRGQWIRNDQAVGDDGDALDGDFNGDLDQGAPQPRPRLAADH